MSLKDALQTLGAAIGLTPMFALEMETATGDILRLRKEMGEPKVGDEVLSPDGEYLMPDGTTIVVENKVISEIRPAVEEEEKVEESSDVVVEDVGGDPLEETTEEKDKEVGDLEAEVERLQNDIAERDAKIAELEAEIERLRTNAKSEQDIAVLNAVKVAGGIDALRKLSSSADFAKRDFEDKKEESPKKLSYREYYEAKHKQ